MTPPDHVPPSGPPLDDGPLDDDALAVQAVVDDEATAEQRRRVARDPELVDRVAALRAAIAAVAAPVDPPPADVLAALRARALDALDAPDEVDAGDTAGTVAGPEADEPAPVAPPPVRDLDAARARRSRSLPPLPAVAAVVILLVVVGVGLLVAGSGGGEDADQASSGGESAEAEAGGGGGDAGGGDSDATVPSEEDLESPYSADEDSAVGDAERPSDELRADLLRQARARFGSDAELVDELEDVDLDTLALAGEVAGTQDGSEGGESPSTTAPTETSSTSRAAANFATDPIVTRCDDVLRSAEPDVEPATAAVLVEVDGVPVLVLSNPVEVSDRAPSGVRLTVLNAVDCSPRAAVLR